VRFLVRYAPANIPRLGEAGLNAASVVFALAMAASAAVICTVMPAASAVRMRLESVVMLAVAGLFLLSYRSIVSADVGFANRDRLTVNLQLRGGGLFASRGLHRRVSYPSF
jgi:hypothetical protein